MPTPPDFIVDADLLYPGQSAPAESDRAVLVRAGRIKDIGPRGAFKGLPRLHAEVAAPGFIDLQINGAGDRQFNDTPDADGLTGMVAGAAKGGTAHLMATFITAPGQAYLAAIAAVAKAVADGLPGVLGLHLEGPFISPEKPGIHPPDAIRHLSPDDLARLGAPANFSRLITLAPERASPDQIAHLARAGWRVFLGHSNATLDEITARADAGLTGATHLFNAMPPLTGREPGPLGAVYGGILPFAGIIADGIHVHPQNLALSLSQIGADRLFLVTDAMLTLGGTAREFTIGARRVRLEDGRLADETGKLGGAHLAMDEAVRNMMQHAGIPAQDALTMASSTPAAALGLGQELGRIAPGFRASLTLLDHGLHAQTTISDGHLLHRTAPDPNLKEDPWAASH